MQSWGATATAQVPSWKADVQQREDALVRELLEADDVDSVLARLENDHYKRMFPALRTLTSFNNNNNNSSDATVLEGPSTNSAATAATEPPMPVPGASSTRSGVARAPRPPPPPPVPDDANVHHASRTATPPLDVPPAWMATGRGSRRTSLRTSPREVHVSVPDAVSRHRGSPPPPPPPPSAPRGGRNVENRDGSPLPANPGALYDSTNRLELSDSGVVTTSPDDVGLHIAHLDGQHRGGDADASTTAPLVPRFSTQTRSPSALAVYDDAGLEDPAQGRIARQLQLLRNYRELADLCAKTSNPSESLFGSIPPEALARQQADQISARLGSPVTVHNNYFFTDPSDSAGRQSHGGAGTRLRSHTPPQVRSRRASIALAEPHKEHAPHSSTPSRVLAPPPPPPPRRSSSAHPSTGGGGGGAGLSSSHGAMSDVSFPVYAGVGAGGLMGTSHVFTPASATASLNPSQRRPPPPPPPPLRPQSPHLSAGNTSLPDSPMAQPIMGGGGHRHSQSAATFGGAGTNATQHSPSRSQRSRSRRLQGMRDVTSTATTEEAGSFDDDEEPDDAYPGDFLDADEEAFEEGYPYSEDPAPAPRIIEREQHRRPQRDGGVLGTTNLTSGGHAGTMAVGDNLVGSGGNAAHSGEHPSRHGGSADGEPLPVDPFPSGAATTTDGANTMIDKGSFTSVQRGSGSADRATPLESGARSVSRINVLSGQDALESEAPASHTRRASGGVGSRPLPSEDLGTEDAERDVELRPDALTGSPTDATGFLVASDRGGSRRASGAASGGRTGVTPEKQRQRHLSQDGRLAGASDDDDTPGNPQLQTRGPGAARRRPTAVHARVPDSRTHRRASPRGGGDDDYLDEPRGRNDRRRRRSSSRSRRARSRHQQQPSWYSDGEGSYSYSSSGYSPYGSEASVDAFISSPINGPVARRRPAQPAPGQAHRQPQSGRRQGPSPSPQERSGTRPHAHTSGSPLGSSQRRPSLSSGVVGSGRGVGGAGRGGAHRGASPATAAARGRGRGRSVSPPRLSPQAVAAPGRGGTPGGPTRGRGRGAPVGRGRGRGGAASSIASPGARSTASTPVWKQVGSTASTAVNSPRREAGPAAAGASPGRPPAPAGRRPSQPPGPAGAPSARAGSASRPRVQPGLLYGSLLPTASPRTAFVVDDPYSLANNDAAAFQQLMIQQQQQQRMAAGYGGGLPMNPAWGGQPTMGSGPSRVGPGPLATPTTAVGNTVSPERPGSLAVVGHTGDVQQLVWKSGSSAVVMGRNWHIPSAPRAEPSRGASAAGVSHVGGGSAAGILMNTSHNTTVDAGAGGYGGGGASPPPQAPSQPRQTSGTPAMTIQVPTDYRMPTVSSLSPSAADHRRVSYGAASTLPVGASAITPTRAAVAANASTPAQRFGITALSS